MPIGRHPVTIGYPLGAPATNDLITRDIYALSNNDRTKFADWVAFRLTVNDVSGECDLSRTWHKINYFKEWGPDFMVRGRPREVALCTKKLSFWELL